MPHSIFLRPWQPEDAGELAAICNNKKIWLNVRDHFPFPYTVNDAVQWIGYNLLKKTVESFAITNNRVIVGSIGFIPKEDVYRNNIEIGYFIAEQYWNKGFASEAVAHLVSHIVQHRSVVRIYAEVFEGNAGSMKVLEKNGFQLESIQQKAIVKNQTILDNYVWVKLVG